MPLAARMSRSMPVLLALLVLALSACFDGAGAPEERVAGPLRDGCTGDHCVDDALGALMSAAWSGDVDALSEPPTGRGDRMRWGYEVIDDAGAPVSGSLALLGKCATRPDHCWVNLYSRQRFEGVHATDVLAALYGDWRWFWRNSAVSSRSERTQVFHPLASLGDRVTVVTQLGEPEPGGSDPLPGLDDAASPTFERWDYRVPLSLTGDFTGQAYLLLAERDGVVHMKEVWVAVQITGAVRRLPALAAVLHLWAVTSRTPHALVGGDEYGLDGHSGWVGLADALEAGVHPLAGQEPYPGRIHETIGDPHVLQRDPTTGGWVIKGSSTVDTIDAAPEDVRDAIFGDLSCWWRHGGVSGLTEETDASGAVTGLRYRLAPILVGGVPLAVVDEHMHAPEPLVDSQGRAGWRIRIDLEGPDFRGPAHFDVVGLPDGRSSVQARFDWVLPTGVWGLNHLTATEAMKNHVRAQQGSMPLALMGSGLPGLITLLERGEPANGDPSCR